MNCIVTGSTGYVGGGIARALVRAGWSVTAPVASGGGRWRLPADPDAAALRGSGAIVHAAWDLRGGSEDEQWETNVAGSRRLFECASGAGVQNMVFISSMSAFEGCRSLYGRMKLAVEEYVLSIGGIVFRPGLVYGGEAGGMVGKLTSLVDRFPLLPLPCAEARQFLVHADDLGEAALRAASGDLPTGIFTLADPHPRTLREIVSSLAVARGRRVALIPIPWRMAWLGLAAAEKCGLRLPLRADNLMGLARANAAPDFRATRDAGLRFRTFPKDL